VRDTVTALVRDHRGGVRLLDSLAAQRAGWMGLPGPSLYRNPTIASMMVVPV
jgi:hypothetical protein